MCERVEPSLEISAPAGSVSFGWFASGTSDENGIGVRLAEEDMVGNWVM